MEVVVRGEAEGIQNGTMRIEKLLNEEQLDGKCRMYAHVTLDPGATLSEHEHNGESETYYILSGEGSYLNDGTPEPAHPGDVFYCGSGHSHAITCVSEEPLVFMALIILG